MRRTFAVLAALGLLISFPLAIAPAAVAVVDAGSCGSFTQTTAENYTCVVPAGVTSLTFDVRAADGGAAWGGYYGSTTPGGLGAKISGTLTVTPGETLYITVGSTGWGYTSPYPQNRDTGGGGGYSSVARMVGTVLTPLVVAGGGGGAGTADYSEPPGYAEAGRGGNGGISGTGGGGAGGHGGTYVTQTNGVDGGLGTTGGVGGTGTSVSGFAGGAEGQNGNWQSTPETPWIWGNYRPGAGGGGFNALGGRSNPNYFVPSGNYPYVFGAPGQGGTAGGGGGGGGYAGGGGGGTLFGYAGGGGGGGSSYVPAGATAEIEAGSAHVTLTGIARPTNDDVANAQLLTGTTGSVSGTTAGATLQELEESNFGPTSNSVWYTWTGSSRKDLVATFTGGDCYTRLLAIETPGSPPGWDTRHVIAYSPTEGCTDQATMKFLATAGTTYWIRVSVGTFGTPGDFTLSWTTASPERGSLAINIANVRKNPTLCTITVKGTNLAAGQPFTVRAVELLTEEIAESRDFVTQSGRWTPEPVSVTRAYWGAPTAYEVTASADFLRAADGVSPVPVNIVNRCGS